MTLFRGTETTLNVTDVDSIADLKLLDNRDAKKVVVSGYYAPGDGGGGEFYWDSTSTDTDNGGTIIQATGVTTGRWKRIYKEPLHVKAFGLKGDGTTDGTTLLNNALSLDEYLEVTDGTYLYTSSNFVDSLKLIGDGSGIIKFSADGRFTCDGVTVDVDGVVFEGPYNAAQYTTGVTGTAISTAFDTPEYLDGADAVYAGADFVHTKAGDVLTTHLSALTGTTRRSVQSDFITVTSTDRYVMHITEGAITDYANFEKITIRKYDASDVYLGDYDPQSSGTDLSLTGAAKIKFRVILKRTSDMATTNAQSTVVDFSKFQLFKLSDQAATATLTDVTSTHTQLGNCVDPVFKNCEWRYMEKVPVSMSSCTRPKFIGNKAKQIWKGWGSTSCTESHFEGNTVDLRQLHTDGSLYNMKFIRTKNIAGTSTDNLVIQNNILIGANWAIEFTPMVGKKSTVVNNTIRAENVGISIPGGDYSSISDNDIELAPGWPLFGIEVPSTHVDLETNNNTINTSDTLTSLCYGIGVTGATVSWVRGDFSNNTISAPVGIWLNTDTSTLASELTVQGNTINYGAVGIFAQKLDATINNNVVRQIKDTYLSAVRNTAITAVGTGDLTVNNNDVLSGLEGALYLDADTLSSSGNSIDATTTLPVLITAVSDTEHFIATTIIQGTVPTAYYSGSGSGTKYSFNNRKVDGSVLLLGTTDHYLTGTHTATITPATGTVTLSGTSDLLSYTRVGDLLTAMGSLAVSAVGAPTGTSVQISLPVAAASSTENETASAAAMAYFDGAAWNSIPADVQAATSYVRAHLDATTVAAGDVFRFSVTYKT